MNVIEKAALSYSRLKPVSAWALGRTSQSANHPVRSQAAEKADAGSGLSTFDPFWTWPFACFHARTSRSEFKLLNSAPA